eukprot:SAG22_NODE_12059_length_458_cov_0.674095_1_plen_76_part_10
MLGPRIISSALLALGAARAAAPASQFPCATVAECTKLPMWHLPGPNPIVAPRGQGMWMSKECEVAGGVIQDGKGLY